MKFHRENKEEEKVFHTSYHWIYGINLYQSIYIYITFKWDFGCERVSSVVEIMQLLGYKISEIKYINCDNKNKDLNGTVIKILLRSN